ncbi:zf-TFIIB domain-containing protein [Angustibacter peucedani]
MSTLTCPKCQSEMRSYERHRVLVDQCSGCGGLFLDRGELEQLAAAENGWHQGPPVQQQSHPQGHPQGYQQSYQQGYPQQHGKPYRKKKSFLSELFDD